MISENNNELNKNGLPVTDAGDDAVLAEDLVSDEYTLSHTHNVDDDSFPEGFDTYENDLLADLESLADELQDYSAPSVESYPLEDEQSEEATPEDETEEADEEASEETANEEDTFEETIDEEEAFEETIDEETLEETADEEDTFEETIDEETFEETADEEEAFEETIDEETFEETADEETFAEEEDTVETTYEEIIPQEEPGRFEDAINELVDELEDKLSESGDENEPIVSSDELLLLAEELSDEPIAAEDDFSDHGAAEDETTSEEASGTNPTELDSLAQVMNNQFEEANFFSDDQETLPTETDEMTAEQTSVESDPDDLCVKPAELDDLAILMNVQNAEANSFGGEEEPLPTETNGTTAEQMSVESDPDDSCVTPAELDDLASLMNVQNAEANSFGDEDEDVRLFDGIEDEDEDVKVFVKKKDEDVKVFVKKTETAATPIGSPVDTPIQNRPGSNSFDQTIVNIPMPEKLPEKHPIDMSDIGQTAVFDPVRPQPSNAETGSRYSSYSEKNARSRAKKQSGFFRGLALIASLLVAVVFISWLLSLVAFSAMGEGNTVSAQEYDYSTTSTIIKPFNDDQEPEPIIIPEFTAEKLTIGDTGDMVDAVQKTLASLGYLAQDKVSGTYDNATKKAVAQFQKANYLEATGEVDRQTYSLIFDANATAPTTRTTDLPTTTEATTSATETTTETTNEATTEKPTEAVTKSTSAQQQETTSLSAAESTNSTTPVTKESAKSSRSEKQTETEPTKPTTVTPSSDDNAESATVPAESSDGPVG